MIRPIFSLLSIYAIAQVMWPLPWPLALKIGVAVVLLLALQCHLRSRLSSGSVFAPEFPRSLMMLFNFAIGATILLAVMQVVLDIVVLMSTVVPTGVWSIPAAWRYAEALAAMPLAAVAV